MSKNINIDEYTQKEDEEILFESLRNPSLFEIIVDRYEQAFIRKAVSILRDKDAAQDVVQDTFVKIYIHAKKFRQDEGASFSSWAYKILLNNCFSVFKKIKRKRELFTAFDDELEAVIADEVTMITGSHFDTDYLISLFKRLPEALARVVYLYVAEGKSYKAIAEDEATSEGAIKVRMHRAKHELRKLVSEIPY